MCMSSYIAAQGPPPQVLGRFSYQFVNAVFLVCAFFAYVPKWLHSNLERGFLGLFLVKLSLQSTAEIRGSLGKN